MAYCFGQLCISCDTCQYIYGTHCLSIWFLAEPSCCSELATYDVADIFFRGSHPRAACFYVQVMDQIEGVNGALLPWEGDRLTDAVRSKLRLFKGALLQLLHRDPLQRPSMREFCRTCSHVLGETTIGDET